MNSSSNHSKNTNFWLFAIIGILVVLLLFITYKRRISSHTQESVVESVKEYARGNMKARDVEAFKKEISDMANKAKQERANQAQASGYPEVRQENQLPKYPNAELSRVRTVLGMDMVTLETDDSLSDVVDFYKSEMGKKGFTSVSDITNDFISMLKYTKGGSTLSITATVQKKTGKTKVQLDYSTTR